MLSVADIMTAYPLRVARDTPAAECIALMRQTRYRHIPVVDEGGRPVALLNDLTVFDRRKEGPSSLEGATALDLADRTPLMLGVEDPLVDVVDRIVEGRQCVALVTDPHGLLIGIVASHDLLRIAPRVVDPDLTARAFAQSPLHAMDRTRPASEAFTLMLEHGVRHVVVLSDGLLYGVVSLFDLIEAGVHEGVELRLDAAIRSAQVDHATEETALRSAALMMVNWSIGCLPVVDAQGRVEAALSRCDVILAVSASLRGVARRPFAYPCAALHGPSEVGA